MIRDHVKGKIMRAIMLLAGTAILSACGGSGTADADGDGKISADEVAAEIANSDINIDPGEWENTVTFKEVSFDESKLPDDVRPLAAQMAQGMQGQSNSTKQCITPEQAAQPQAEFFSGNENQDCEYKEFSMSGGNMNWSMECKGPDGSIAALKANGSYTSTSYALDMEVSAEGGEIGQMLIKASTNGQHLGACK